MECNKEGAIICCEVSECNRNYHYHCAVQQGCQLIDDVRHPSPLFFLTQNNVEC